MAAVLRLAGIGDAAPVAFGAVFATLTVKASSYDASGALAGEVSSDLRRCWPARCGPKTACGAASTTSPS